MINPSRPYARIRRKEEMNVVQVKARAMLKVITIKKLKLLIIIIFSIIICNFYFYQGSDGTPETSSDRVEGYLNSLDLNIGKRRRFGPGLKQFLIRRCCGLILIELRGL